MFIWPDNLALGNITSTSDAGYEFWKDRCLFLSNIDTEKVKVFLDIDNFSLNVNFVLCLIWAVPKNLISIELITLPKNL